MNMFQWALLVAIAAGGFARLAKIWPRLPKGALPWMTLATGYGMTLVKLHWLDDVQWSAALDGAWLGVGSGMVAIGGHEVFKRTLRPWVGEAGAAAILGRLPQPPNRKPPLPPAALLVAFAVAATLTLPACSALMPAVAKVAQVGRAVARYLDMIDHAGAAWFAERPDPDKRAEMVAALGRCRDALLAVDRLAAGAESASDGGDPEVELIDSYRALYRIAESIPGFLDSAGMLGASSSSASAATPDELESMING